MKASTITSICFALVVFVVVIVVMVIVALVVVVSNMVVAAVVVVITVVVVAVSFIVAGVVVVATIEVVPTVVEVVAAIVEVVGAIVEVMTTELVGAPVLVCATAELKTEGVASVLMYVPADLEMALVAALSTFLETVSAYKERSGVSDNDTL